MQSAPRVGADHALGTVDTRVESYIAICTHAPTTTTTLAPMAVTHACGWCTSGLGRARGGATVCNVRLLLQAQIVLLLHELRAHHTQWSVDTGASGLRRVDRRGQIHTHSDRVWVIVVVMEWEGGGGMTISVPNFERASTRTKWI